MRVLTAFPPKALRQRTTPDGRTLRQERGEKDKGKSTSNRGRGLAKATATDPLNSARTMRSGRRERFRHPLSHLLCLSHAIKEGMQTTPAEGCAFCFAARNLALPEMKYYHYIVTIRKSIVQRKDKIKQTAGY
ncbi:hypothetical protein HAX54_008088 [Datura stramonium]|uniref:Uncharacterized protein n=1 Tax=Datura stramonium TaxID=4076 RepID=A0ABS8TF67_DATST|nr:hypothetical protein [Datura stramonium]